MPPPTRPLALALAGLAAAALAGAVAAQPRLPEPSGAPAEAQTPPPTAQVRPWSDVTRLLEARGYVIHELDRERDGFEAEVTAADGRRLELRLDAAGRILREARDD